MKMIKTKLNGKYELYLPEHRANREEWHNEKGWEKARLDSMHSMIGKGDVVYYVGTELAEFPALCALWGAKVVNFEPNLSAWPCIKQTFEANKVKPLYNFMGFASDKTELEPKNPDERIKGLWENKNGWPLASEGEIIEAHGFSELYQEADGLPQVKLDDMMELFSIPPPTVITFDCEGSDWQLMKGAEQILRKYKPKIWASIHPEMMFHQWGQYSRNFRDWIIDFGYDEQYLAYDHELHMYYSPNGKPAK